MAPSSCAWRSGGKPCAQATRGFGDGAVAGAVADGLVELGIEGEVAGNVLRLDHGLGLLVQRLERVLLDLGHALGGKAGTEAFQLAFGIEQVGHLLGADPRDLGAAAAADRDQAARREVAQGLAHRRAGGHEAGGERLLLQPFAGLEAACDDVLGQPADDAGRRGLGLAQASAFSTGATSFTAPRQPVSVASKTMPSGVRYFTS
ncbi:MAG: hypothetical protein QM747_17195 [Nocardioides sp.]